MSKQVSRRRGTAAQHQSFTGSQGEITVDTTNNRIVVHDGTTAGGHTGVMRNDIFSNGFPLLRGPDGETIFLSSSAGIALIVGGGITALSFQANRNLTALWSPETGRAITLSGASCFAGAPMLPTTSTTGFFAIPKMAGIPSATPNFITGYVPMVYNSVNNRLYIHNNTGWWFANLTSV